MSNIRKHTNACNSFTDTELKFDLVGAESHSHHILWMSHLVILYEITKGKTHQDKTKVHFMQWSQTVL